MNVRAANLDFYVSGTLKYLLGAPDLAFLYVRKELIESLRPTTTGWFAQTNPFAFDVKHLDLALSARRFEAGSPPVPNIYAAMRGIQLLQEIGLVLQCKDAPALVQKLAASGIVCSNRHDGLRLSFHVYNMQSDVESVLEVLERNLDLLAIGATQVTAD